MKVMLWTDEDVRRAQLALDAQGFIVLANSECPFLPAPSRGDVLPTIGAGQGGGGGNFVVIGPATREEYLDQLEKYSPPERIEYGRECANLPGVIFFKVVAE